MGDKVGENPAALRAAVFFAILEKPEGGAFKRPPPAGHGLTILYNVTIHNPFVHLRLQFFCLKINQTTQASTIRHSMSHLSRRVTAEPIWKLLKKRGVYEAIFGRFTGAKPLHMSR